MGEGRSHWSSTGLEEISNVLFRPTYTPKFDMIQIFVMYLSV